MKRLAGLAVLLSVAAPAAFGANPKHRAAVRADKAKLTATVTASSSAPVAAPVSAPAPLSAPVPAPASASNDDIQLALFGTSLSEDGEGLLAADTRPGSPAESLGLRRADRVWFVNHAAPALRSEAAAALRAESPLSRESIVVRRGLETLALSGPESPLPSDFVRASSDLTAHERAVAAARSVQDAARARDAVAEAAPLEWTLHADQSFWVRFPGGLPVGLKRDDVVEAETSTGLTTDGTLDFLAVPPQSRVWARVTSASDAGEINVARLVFFKMRPVQGRIYPILGVATALAGTGPLLSAGGTLVKSAPLPPADGKKSRGGKELFLDGDARMRVRLISPVTLAEAPSWWRAGPGVWFKSATDAQGRHRFVVTHVVADRSASAAGVKTGDWIDFIEGRPAEKFAFQEALSALYGAPGTTVKISVAGPTASKTFDLARGVKVDGKSAAPLPLPYENR